MAAKHLKDNSADIRTLDKGPDAPNFEASLGSYQLGDTPLNY